MGVDLRNWVTQLHSSSNHIFPYATKQVTSEQAAHWDCSNISQLQISDHRTRGACIFRTRSYFIFQFCRSYFKE